MSTSLSNYGGSDGYKFYKGTSSPIPNQVIVNSDNVTEGSTNLYFTTARARSSISAGGALTYNSTTGEVSYTPPTILTDINISHSDDSTLGSAKSVKTYVDSQIQANDHLSELSGTLDDITTGTTNVHFTATNETKLTSIEVSADVTDTANVTAAGALMDSELTDLAGVKGVTISTLQPKPSEGAFVDGDKTKLDGVESGATADQTGAEIKSLYESEPNAFTDADHTKLDGIEASATANDTDANLKSRANHTGTQAASTISDFDTEVANNSAVTANTAKVTNATHTGDATGSGALTVVALQGRAIQSSAPSDGQVLKWNNSASEWQAMADNNSGGGGGGGTPAGSTGQIQFNSGGSFGADSNLVWDDSNNRLGIGGSPSQALHVQDGSALIKGDGQDLLIESTDENLFLIGNRSGGEPDKAYLRMKSGGTNTIVLDTAGDTFFNGGNVGIGATNPAPSTGSDTTLEIKGDDGPSLTINDTGQAEKYSLIANSNDLKIAYGSTYLASFQNDGNVGIGTTSPNIGSWGKALTINSDSTASSCSLELAQGGTLYGFVGVQGSGSSNALDIAAYQSQDIRFRVGASGGTQAMVIDSSGTTRATGDLIIAHDSTTTDAGNTLAFHTTTAGWATANAHATISGKRTDASNGYLTFSTRGSGTTTERMRIDSSGDLTVKGGRLYVQESDLGNTAVALTRDADEGYVQIFSGGTQTAEFRGNGDSYFNGGNLGVGSTSPSERLHVNSAATNTVALFESTDAGAGIKLTDTTGSSTVETNQTDLRIGVDEDGAVANSTMSFRVDGSTKLRIDSDGIVSISSDLSAETPPLKISQSGAGDASIQFNISGVTNWTAGVDNNDGDKFKISNGSALSSNPRLTVDSSGNIGIGTISPTFSSGGGLHINDASRANLKIETGSSACEQFVDGNDFYLDHYPSGSIVFRSDTRTERMRIDSGGASYFYGQLNVAGGSGTTTNRLNISYNASNGVAEIAPDSDSGSTELKFSTCLSATKAEAMRIKSTGRVTVKKSSNAEVTALTDGATITPNLNDANNFSVTLGGNRTLANPSNCTAGQSGIITITQPAGSTHTLVYGSYWKFSGGTAPNLTTAASAVDVLAYYVESATRITATLITDTK